MVILLSIIFLFVICFLVPFHFGTFDPKPHDETPESDITVDAATDEKRINLENAITKYNRLLSILDLEYQNKTDNKKRIAILTKQTATLEKLNRTIEKLEKLE